MHDQIKNASLDWHNGKIPISKKFGDAYFSLYDGLAETNHVFLSGNNLPNRFQNNFHIAELGFGTGLNLLATWHAWIKSGQTTPLKFTSFEAFPMELSDMSDSLKYWPELNSLATELFNQLEKGWNINTPTLNAEIIIGDARRTLKSWEQSADAWFLDGFSPAKNPEMWEQELLNIVAEKTLDQGTFSTYSAAGFVRQRLTNAGFLVERIKGFNKKKHMSIGKKV